MASGFCYNYICPDYKHGQLIRKIITTNDGFVIDEIYEYGYQKCDTIPIMQISYGAKEWRDNYTYYDLLVSDYITGKAYLKTKTTYSYRNLDDLVDPLITQNEQKNRIRIMSMAYFKVLLPFAVEIL